MTAQQQQQQPAGQDDDPEGLGRAYDPLRDPVASDADMATAVAHNALSGFCWAGGLGWRRYDDRLGIWAAVPEEVTLERVRRSLLAIVAMLRMRAADEASRGKPGDYYEGLAGAWRKYATASRINAITRLARGICLVDPSRFDARPDLLNCPDGVLDLRTGQLGPHDPGLLLTQVGSAGYVAGAQHPDITKALQAIPDDARDYAQLRYGQAVTGYKPPDDAIDVQHGSGENGKTTVLSAIRSALGDYCTVLPQRVLLASPGDHSTELMTLRGVRVGIIEELPEEHQLSVTRIKIATAPQITARMVYRDNVTFANACALIISTNYRPVIRETDHGTWRRLEGSIPFPYTYRKPHERLRDGNDRRGDGTLRQRIETDDGPRAEAMLAWLAEGARRWYAGSTDREPQTMGEPPASVREDIRAWRESCDLLYGYLTERQEFDPGSHVISDELREDMNGWLRGRGHREWSAETLAARLSVHSEAREHQVVKIRPREGQAAGLSRRPGFGHMPPPGRYNAWSGLRFRVSPDYETAGRSGWSGPGQTNPMKGSLGEVTFSPDHPDQRSSNGVPGIDFAALYDMADFSVQPPG